MKGRPKGYRNPEIAVYIKTTRAAWGLSMRGMADRLGVSLASLAQYERGLSAPPVEKCVFKANASQDEKLYQFWRQVAELRTTPISSECYDAPALAS